MKRVLFLLAALALHIQAFSAQPNIVLMLVDDMGVMDTSVPFLTDSEGRPKRYPLNDFYRTPNMERLAALGVRFSNFNAMSVCSPTRISIMTGQNAARHRTTNWINPANDNAGPQGAREWNWRGLKRGDVTLPSLLKTAGYRTIHVGKGHLGPRNSDGADPLTLGFDINVGGAAIGQPGSYYGTQNFGNADGKRAGFGVPGLERYHGQEIFLTEALTLEAKAHIGDAVKAGKPFFLNFAQYAVHAPFQSDARFAAHYAASGKSAGAQAFATLIEGMDKSLGDLLDHVQELGVAENTLFIFLGDNGSDAPLGGEHVVASSAPLRGKKGSHYEGGVRVPFIAAWAKNDGNHPAQKRMPIPAGAVQTQLAAVHDLFPTLLAAAGSETPAEHAVDGVKLAPLFSGKPDSARPVQFLMHYPHGPHRSSYWTSFRDGDWKVIYHYFPAKDSGGARYQLFNLKDDPFEQTDLAAKDGATLKRMMQGLVAALESHKAVYPVEKGTGTAVKPVLP